MYWVALDCTGVPIMCGTAAGLDILGIVVINYLVHLKMPQQILAMQSTYMPREENISSSPLHKVGISVDIYDNMVQVEEWFI